MDNIDIRILKLLQKNARITASEIGNTINLSIPAVSDRLKKLESNGTIEKYIAVLNTKKLNKSLTVIMFLSLESPNFIDKLIDFVHKEDEIIECLYLAGDFDYALKICTCNTETLESILNRIKLITGVQKTKTTVALSTIKNTYSIVPPRETK